MSRRSLVLLPVLALALAAQARDPKGGSDRARQSDAPAVARQSDAPVATRVADIGPLDQQDVQRRRDVLRQATRVQMQETPTPARQLSAQERAELRQQLQLQRQELLK